MATAELGSWLERLASIMELKACEPGTTYPKLIFTQGEPGRKEKARMIYELDRSVHKDLPTEGWRCHRLRWMQVWFHHDIEDVICDIGYEGCCTADDREKHQRLTMSMWLSLHPIKVKAELLGALPFHAALVKRNGFGVLLAGPGETGKSTCCRRIPSPWQAVCDDETLIIPHHNRQYIVHPFPTWSDHIFRRCEKTWNVQQHLSLSAIFFLEQAKNDEAIEIGQGQAAVKAFRSYMQTLYVLGLRMDREEKLACNKKVFNNACKLAKAVPSFILRVNLAGQFWEEMERVLAKLQVPRKSKDEHNYLNRYCAKAS